MKRRLTHRFPTDSPTQQVFLASSPLVLPKPPEAGILLFALRMRKRDLRHLG